MNAVILLRIVLIAFTICSALFLIVDLIKHKDEIHFKKGITLALIGLFTNMLDTWQHSLHVSNSPNQRMMRLFRVH